MDVSGHVDELGGLRWRKSTFSNPNGNCVELATVPAGGIAVRNSRDPDGTVLLYTPAEIAAFVLGVKSGQFDDLLGGQAVAAGLA